jgi:aryl-alcohol dehydrogenase-like predicted oxidoreductase
VRLAAEAGGADHHFRYIQLPFNLQMAEAYTGGILQVAEEHGLTVVASASLLQAQLARELPQELASLLPGLATDAQRAIQFTRSTPGITVALVGMSRVAHVEENLRLALVPPLTPENYRAFHEPAK